LPYPTDLYFAGSADGTLNIPSQNTQFPDRAALNALDGFSTTTAVRARFSAPIAQASVTGQSVIVLQVAIDNVSKAVTGLIRPLVFGADYSANVGSEPGVANTVLEIHPTRPLVPSSGATNNGYLVLLTRGITDTAGKPVGADHDYAASPQTAAHLSLAQAIGINPADVVVSFSFSTQSTTDSLGAIAKVTTPQPLVIHSTGLTTAQANPKLSGHATLYVGTLTIPYYLSRTAALTGSWQGAASPLDANSHLLTRFNPLPVPTETLQIPVLVTVPNANSAGGGTKPSGGKWPVLVFQHGFGRNRTDALSVADAFADSGFVVVAIDLPLHGVTDPTSPFYASASNPLYAGLSLPAGGSIERTFDLDVYNNKTGAPGADGRIDASGASFINLASLLTTRDNLREGAADLITLVRSVPNMTLDDDSAGDIDPANIQFLGHSLGAMVGTAFLGVVSNTEIGSATLAMPGGGLAQLLNESATFGPRLRAALQARGLAPQSAGFEQFLQAAQTVWDSGDPLNYMAAAAHHPLHLMQIVGSGASPPDQLIPNSATQRLIEAADLLRIAAPGTLGPMTHAQSFNGYVNFITGDHESLVDPTASLAATIEMQAEAISFAGAPVPPIPQRAFPGSAATPPGSALLVLNPPVIQP
jgi:hypothetical protein